jgi:hypothetical protein
LRNEGDGLLEVVYGESARAFHGRIETGGGSGIGLGEGDFRFRVVGAQADLLLADLDLLAEQDEGGLRLFLVELDRAEGTERGEIGKSRLLRDARGSRGERFREDG